MKKTSVVIIIILSVTIRFTAAGNKKIILMDFQNLSAYNAYGFLKKYMRRIYKSVLQSKYNVIPRANYSRIIQQINNISENYLFNEKIGFQLCRVLNSDAVIMGRFLFSSETKFSMEIMILISSTGKKRTFKETVDTTKENLLKDVHQISMKMCKKILYSIK